MTSGQGGQDPQQGWRPPEDQPGWQAPPAQQGWQNPPPQQGGWQNPPQQQPGWQNPPQQPGWQDPQQGWQDPQQGWQAPPPYGYANAPWAPGHQLPQEAPPRPDTVRFGIGAFVAYVILNVVAYLVGSDSIVDQQLAGSGIAFSEETRDSFAVLVVVFGLLFEALRGLFIFFAWKGHNWARIVLFVLGGLGIAGGVLSLGAPSAGFLSALAVFQTLLLIVGIVLLARRPSSEWYRAMTARRQAGLR